MEMTEFWPGLSAVTAVLPNWPGLAEGRSQLAKMQAVLVSKQVEWWLSGQT
jgi:hypothetical protein